MRITTEILGEHPPLLDIAINDLPATSWVRNNEGLIGFGEYKRFTLTGSDRFEKAREWWRNEVQQLDIHNNVHGSGTGPILFTSFSFSETEESVLIIPQVLIGQKNGKSWITWIGDKQPEITSQPNLNEPLTLQWSGSNGDEWRSRVATAISAIKSNEVEKVVLARFIDCATDKPLNVRRILRNLADEYPSTWVFSNAGLIGATPELDRKSTRLNSSH